MTAPPHEPPSRPTSRLWAAIVLSAGAHAAVAFTLLAVFEAPAVPIEFSMPDEIEFGVTDAIEVREPTPTVTEAPAAMAPDATPTPPAEPVAPDPAPAPRPKPKPKPAPKAEDPAGGADAPQPASPEAAEARARELSLPAGAQLALRLDMTRLRESKYAPRIRAFLEQVPDWRALLGGSGIDPLTDIDRLMVASPNLRSGRMLVAGRTGLGEGAVREATARMAENHSAAAEWRRAHGVWVTDWHHDSDIPRTVALLGPAHFAITRPEDLPRLLAVAEARRAEEERPRGRREDRLESDALLSMGEGDAVTFEVEGAARYMRSRTAPLPERLRVRMRELEAQAVEVRVEGRFASAEEAERAVAFWDAQRAHFARNLFVVALGLAGALEGASFETDAEAATARLVLTPQNIDFILSYIEGMFREWAGPASSPPAGASTQDPPAAAPATGAASPAPVTTP